MFYAQQPVPIFIFHIPPTLALAFLRKNRTAYSSSLNPEPFAVHRASNYMFLRLASCTVEEANGRMDTIQCKVNTPVQGNKKTRL